MRKHTPLIFLIAGEASGDRLGADLMEALKAEGKIRFAGIGGSLMEAQGMQSLFPLEELSLMGVVSILKNLPHLLRRLHETVETIQRLKPDVVVTIDAPEFSFRVMKRLHKLPNRPRLIHYVAPTVWAWRPGRAKKIAGFLDHLLCLYPFEPPLFTKWGLPATFVGHPIACAKTAGNIRDPHLLCILPGSRVSEVTTLLPIFGKTVALLQKIQPKLQVVLPTLPVVETLVRQGVEGWTLVPHIVLEREKAFATASTALAASGTVTLELAAAHLPFVVAYKIGPITAWIVRHLIKTPWVCMVNVLLNLTKKGSTPTIYIPEYLQQDCTPEKLAAALERLITNQSVRGAQEKAMAEAIGLLKSSSPDVAAHVVREQFLSHIKKV